VTITREQVADLQPGDVVEMVASHWPEGTSWRGPLYGSGGELRVAGGLVRYDNGDPMDDARWSLTVVSRAPRPLYVNHPRTEPVPGDVVREDDPEGAATWLMDSFGTWQSKDSTCRPEHMEGRLRLLVDGETGQVVP
jgi:hypothetical protein